MKNTIYTCSAIGVFLFLLLLGIACSVNPVTGKKDFNLLSEKQEIALGKESDPGIVAGYGLYEDSIMQRFIESKGQQMAKISHRPHLDYEFKILDSPVVNAFAVPGGFVYFTRGIMAHFNNEAEFAGVLGHEIGHITAKHSARQYSSTMLAQVGFIIGVVASKEFREFADVAQQGMGLMFLKFGRDHESQSDQLGVEYSTKIGYDAKEMANFFKTLDRMRSESGAGEIPTFLSTHPNPADRFRKVGQAAAKWQQGKDPKSFKVERDRYLRMIDGLVYGEDPRQGYVDKDWFYHPVLKFQFPIPRGWKTANSPLQFQMAPNDGKAMMMLRLAQGKTPDEAAQAFVQQNQMTVVESNRVNVNGLNATAVVSDQVNQEDPNGTLRILSYFIQYNGLIYNLTGLSLKKDFNAYVDTFSYTMRNFDKLTDPAKINVQPKRVHIKTIKQNGTFSATLKSLNVPSNQLNEIAILNSMQLNDQVKKGMLIKIVE